MQNDDVDKFAELYRANVDALFAYALSRSSPDRAAEVVEETFLVAWRRLDQLPVEARPWLFGVARKVLAHQRRASERQVALGLRAVAYEASEGFEPDHAEHVVEHERVLSGAGAAQRRRARPALPQRLGGAVTRGAIRGARLHEGSFLGAPPPGTQAFRIGPRGGGPPGRVPRGPGQRLRRGGNRRPTQPSRGGHHSAPTARTTTYHHAEGGIAMTKAPAFQRLASARPEGLTEVQRAAIFSRIVSSSPQTVDGPSATEPWEDAGDRPHWRRPRLAGAAAAVAVAAGVTVALSTSGVVLNTAPAVAFAGWSATPAALGTSPSPTASAACLTQLDYGPPFKEATTGSWVPVVTDVRGPFTLGVYADAGASATCPTGPTITVVAANSIAGGDPSVASGSVQLDGGLYLRAGRGFRPSLW